MALATTTQTLRTGTQVLLVEDNPAEAKLIIHFFRAADFSGYLHWVSDGEQALEFLFRKGSYTAVPKPHFILLDLNLPRIDGLSILRRVKTDPVLHSIPVIVLTNSRQSRDMVRSYELEATSYLVKPNQLEDYEVLVQRLISVEFARG